MEYPDAMISRSTLRRSIASVILVAALAVALGAGCKMSSDVPERSHAKPARPIENVQRDHTDELMAIPGVVGVYLGALDDGTPFIGVMVVERTPELARRIPKEIEGHPVRIDVTGEIRPLLPGEK